MGLSTDGFAITPYLHSWAYDQTAHQKKKSFLAHYKGRTTEVRADSREEAFRLLSGYFRTRQTKQIQLKELPQ